MPKGILTDKQVDKLIDLGPKIQMGLECNLNGTGLPCRTDRLDAVDNMIKYVKLHGYKVEEKNKK
jgi:hypothetical protein|tara:strand:+ start:408 stop:602 length:195 start_codon:yes stop_codon:yes gene_type:complete